MDQLLPGLRTDPLRVATLGEIFATKAYVCSQRSKTRDWFDLYTLMTQRAYTFEGVYGIYKAVNSLPAFAIMTSRLRKCRPELADEGYLDLTTNPPSLDAMRDLFNHALDQLERHLAKEAFLKSNI